MLAVIPQTNVAIDAGVIVHLTVHHSRPENKDLLVKMGGRGSNFKAARIGSCLANQLQIFLPGSTIFFIRSLLIPPWFVSLRMFFEMRNYSSTNTSVRLGLVKVQSWAMLRNKQSPAPAFLMRCMPVGTDRIKAFLGLDLGSLDGELSGRFVAAFAGEVVSMASVSAGATSSAMVLGAAGSAACPCCSGSAFCFFFTGKQSRTFVQVSCWPSCFRFQQAGWTQARRTTHHLSSNKFSQIVGLLQDKRHWRQYGLHQSGAPSSQLRVR